ncbi:MAG: hypothetical protein QGI68_18805 [Pseudomonadales bacterium]|nr:hypothetical protein [Pseudomonadales bacterium]MDP7357023.1 hypothetical protein [Pseudomonadales bacterium]MDP7597596.1 hypothetical protein [Pseudomonadales bacterium]HJN51811.1 hypothetical protein [Pseudomonadales bacterium]
MSTQNDFPRFDRALPALAAFIRDLTASIQTREIDTEGKAERAIKEFFTQQQLNNLAQVAPAWNDLLEYEGARTLCHVVTALASLPYYPEYNEASQVQQTIIAWALLYHDIAKRSKHAKDHGHAFRSAVAAARSLPLIGVDLPESYHSGIDGWSELTLAAIGDGTTDGNHVDNRTLPHILEQLDAMLAQDSASSRIVKIILFHHSITTVTDWPQPNPLSDTEILQYFDSELLHLMRIMLLADSDGWELFHASTCHAYRLETRGVFDRLRQAIAP